MPHDWFRMYLDQNNNVVKSTDITRIFWTGHNNNWTPHENIFLLTQNNIHHMRIVITWGDVIAGHAAEFYNAIITIPVDEQADYLLGLFL